MEFSSTIRKYALHISGMTFISIPSMYLHKFIKFIIPSIGISEPISEKQKISQNILFCGYFTTAF